MEEGFGPAEQTRISNIAASPPSWVEREEERDPVPHTRNLWQINHSVKKCVPVCATHQQRVPLHLRVASTSLREETRREKGTPLTARMPHI